MRGHRRGQLASPRPESHARDFRPCPPADGARSDGHRADGGARLAAGHAPAARRATLGSVLLTLAALGYVGFVAAYAIQYRDFSVMKAIFMLAGLLGLVMLFIDGGRRGHPLHAAGSIGDGEDGGRLQGSRAPLFLGPLGSELPYAPQHDAAVRPRLVGEHGDVLQLVAVRVAEEHRRGRHPGDDDRPKIVVPSRDFDAVK